MMLHRLLNGLTPQWGQAGRGRGPYPVLIDLEDDDEEEEEKGAE